MKIVKLLIIVSTFFILAGSVCEEEAFILKEARGIWVSRWEWAVEEDGFYEEVQKNRIIEILDKVQRAKCNIVFFQVRGNGDAFYRSNYEPWSVLLSGALGQDPGWDPLVFALEHAHRRGLELHAWFNTFPAWRGRTPPAYSMPEHVYNRHPEWLICDRNGTPMRLSDGYVYLSPGIPRVRQYIHDVAMDIVLNYDIDGIHFDYIRYPEKASDLGYSHDPLSVQLFRTYNGNPDRLNWDDWQRENINSFVRTFYDAATGVKPWLKISAAVIGKFDYSEWNGYHAVFQDGVQWVREGKMDFIVPMIYWQSDHPTSGFEDVTRYWNRLTGSDRMIPGMLINRLGEEDWPVEEIVRQLGIAREYSRGLVLFSYGGLEKMNIARGFQYHANVPPMPWKITAAPPAPVNLQAHFLSNGVVRISWDLSGMAQDYRFNVFRSTSSPVDCGSARQLVHVTPLAETHFYDSHAEAGQEYHYAVTALDRAGNESQPSEEAGVRVPYYAITEKLTN
jgi:uncharacterized lipoprotein YddW (UPF0748 family)